MTDNVLISNIYKQLTQCKQTNKQKKPELSLESMETI